MAIFNSYVKLKEAICLTALTPGPLGQVTPKSNGFPY